MMNIYSRGGRRKMLAKWAGKFCVEVKNFRFRRALYIMSCWIKLNPTFVNLSFISIIHLNKNS